MNTIEVKCCWLLEFLTGQAILSHIVFVFTVIEGGIAQAVPEHPKRENIFALSTAFGDAYLFEVRHYNLDCILLCLMFYGSWKY